MIQRRILVVFLVVLLAFPTLAGSEQTPAASAIPAEDELTGLQASVWRSYAPAGTFEGTGTINLDEVVRGRDDPAQLDLGGRAGV